MTRWVDKPEVTKDRILVTGASGFIGRATVATLLAHDLPVNLAVRKAIRFSNPTDNNRLKIFVTGDLAAQDFATNLHPAFADVRTVVHLAGLAHIATADGANADSLFLHSNVAATRNLVELALSHEVSSFIHLSSLAAITANTSANMIDDNTSIPPSTGYGRSKFMAETQVQRLTGAGIFAASLRPPLVVGSGARGNWAALQKLARSGLPLPFGSLRYKRSFVSIQTLTEAIFALSRKPPSLSLSGNYCIADPEPVSVAQVVTALREGMGMPPRLFNCPSSLFAILGAMTGRQRQLSSLIGQLEVNPSRFYTNFAFSPTVPLIDAIRNSATEFIR
jgi:UDP-glucose 4-epimerase